MLGRVTAALHKLPVAPADIQRLEVHQAAVALRERAHRFAKKAETLPVMLQLVFAIAGPAIKIQGRPRRRPPGVGDQGTAHEILRPRHPQIAAETLTQPAGESDVVRVHMGTDHPGERPPAQSAVKQRGPDFPGLGQGEASIDDGPARAILQQPQIDVI